MYTVSTLQNSKAAHCEPVFISGERHGCGQQTCASLALTQLLSIEGMHRAQQVWTCLMQVADFFAHLVKRVSPKSYTQALAEVLITRRFLENFAGDSVRSSSSVLCACHIPFLH